MKASAERTAGHLCRVRDAVGSLGVRAVLLAYWGTVSVLSRCCTKRRMIVGESVRRKA